MRMLAVLTCALFSVSAMAGGLEVGEPVPAFDIKLTDGRHVTPTAAAGRVTIINFWATWCAPCRKEMPALEEFYRKYHTQGVDVIAVSIDKASVSGKPAALCPTGVPVGTISFMFSTMEIGHEWDGRKAIG